MKREQWGGRLAFVLAAAGSAVGLGNIWKFPYITGIYGGGAFILVYLVCIVLVGMPIMIAELVIGRATQKSPIAAFKQLAPKSAWWVVGAMGVMAGYVILSFYSVVAGWTMEYVLRSAQGNYTGLKDEAALMALKDDYVKSAADAKLRKQIDALKKQLGEETVDDSKAWSALGGEKKVKEQLSRDAEKQDIEAFAIGRGFSQYTGSKTKPLVWHLAFMALTMFVVSAGVGAGIEKASKVLMPILILIVVGIAIKGMSLKGSWAGVEFLISPDFTKITQHSILEALGHAFFTLSLGMGAMLTYGSYLSDETNLYKAGFMVAVADTVIALIAGFAIYPMVFAFGLDANAGPGLIFVTLPVLFSRMPGGYMIGALFFFALFMAALTSAISLLEVCVAHFVDGWGWDRRKATMYAGVAILLLGVPTAVGAEVPGVSSFFNIMDKFSSNFLLPVGGMLTALFVGFGWKRDELFAALEPGDEGMTAAIGPLWLPLCRFVAPVLVAVVVLNQLGILKL